MPQDLTARIDALIDQWAEKWPTVPGWCVAIDRPGGEFAVARGCGQEFLPEHAVRIASCTKPFVASTVLVLAGRDLLALDQPAIQFLDPESAALFRRFEHGTSATVRHLLQHRSGLVDHSNFPEFETVVDNDPQHQWTALEQIAIAMDRPALFAPDTAFSYSDTGYVLLGQMVEHLTGRSLAAAVRDACRLDALDMPSIHWEIAEPAPPGLVRAHQYFEAADIHGWNPSLDLFGGGGIVATMPDLARWWSALFDGRVHSHLARQIAAPRSTLGPDGSAFPGGEAIGLGLFRTTFGTVPVWSHGGFWGLTTSHIPSLRTSIAMVMTRRWEGGPVPVQLHGAIVEAVLAS